MTRPWRCLDRVATDEGELKCLVRGDDDYMITIDGRVLMVSHASRSEEALAQLARDAAGEANRPARVLVGGLGMGYTLRAALDAWPASAAIVVCEVNPVVVDWCRGPLASLCGDVLADPRVTVLVEDVAAVIRRASKDVKYDVILLDLYEGPNEARRGDPGQAHYTTEALQRTREALRRDGVVAFWSEAADAAFEKRLTKAGLKHQRHHPDRTARRHVVYLAR